MADVKEKKNPSTEPLSFAKTYVPLIKTLTQGDTWNVKKDVLKGMFQAISSGQPCTTAMSFVSIPVDFKWVWSHNRHVVLEVLIIDPSSPHFGKRGIIDPEATRSRMMERHNVFASYEDLTHNQYKRKPSFVVLLLEGKVTETIETSHALKVIGEYHQPTPSVAILENLKKWHPQKTVHHYPCWHAKFMYELKEVKSDIPSKTKEPEKKPVISEEEQIEVVAQKLSQTNACRVIPRAMEKFNSQTQKRQALKSKGLLVVKQVKVTLTKNSGNLRIGAKDIAKVKIAKRKRK